MLKSVMIYDQSGAIEDDDNGWESDEGTNVAEFVQVEYSEGEREDTGPKRRARKSKYSYETSEVRKSSRSRVPVNSEKNDYVWSLEEKKALLAAVKKYGHLDMEHLCEAVPYKTKYAIRTIIVKWWRRAAMYRQSEIEEKPMLDRRFKEYKILHKKRNKNKRTQSKLAPIEEWIAEFRKASTVTSHGETKTLAKAMLYISLFEKHPDPAECGGIDFSALYDYLYRMLMGYPPKDLNEATIKYLLNVMDSLTTEIKDGDFHSQIFHLKSVRKISLKPTTIRQYGSKKETNQKSAQAEDAWMKSLLETDGFDPLSTGLSLLKRK